MKGSPISPEHITWLVEANNAAATADGVSARIWEFNHEENPEVLSKWAKHFRNHYCSDDEIDFMQVGESRSDYLNDMKFPTQSGGLGPSIRAGDFGEILVADLIEWLLGFWVPRVRWGSKVIRNESPKGSDVIGFQFFNENDSSDKDILAIFEAKTKFSKSGNNKLQDAINDSAKDHLRIAESLNFIKQKLREKGKLEEGARVERFQSPIDNPYRNMFGAAALIDTAFETEANLLTANAHETPCPKNKTALVPHPNLDDLQVVVIKGSNMMQLVHKLYKLAADE